MSAEFLDRVGTDGTQFWLCGRPQGSGTSQSASPCVTCSRRFAICVCGAPTPPNTEPVCIAGARLLFPSFLLWEQHLAPAGGVR
jgi:hypothetical protein